MRKSPSTASPSRQRSMGVALITRAWCALRCPVRTLNCAKGRRNGDVAWAISNGMCRHTTTPERSLDFGAGLTIRTCQRLTPRILFKQGNTEMYRRYSYSQHPSSELQWEVPPTLCRVALMVGWVCSQPWNPAAQKRQRWALQSFLEVR